MVVISDDIDPQALAKVNDKGFVPDEVRDSFFRKLRMKNENRTCFECSGRNPQWISITYGVYLCLECSGEHRRKGVHLSFVRGLDLDSYTPESMVQMAVGGNNKAWTHFKQHGMGKTSEARRPVDYSSKIAIRYKETILKDTADTCRALGVHMKGDAVEAVVEAPVAAVAQSPTNGSAGKPAAAAPVVAPAAKATPAAGIVKVAQPQMVRKAVPAVVSSATITAAPEVAAPVKPAFVASSKQVAKEIDFDFDFGDIEAEAKKPAPKPEPKATPAPVSAPVVAAAPVKTFSQPATTAASGGVDKKFNNSKGISSDDFFADETQETPQQRMEREGRYQKMAGSGAISSDAFFW